MLMTPWRSHGLTAPDTHLFAIGDVHGQGPALERLLSHISRIPYPTCFPREIIYLGDLIDRGPASLQSVNLAWRCEGFQQHTILPGNHELMLLDTLDHPELWEDWFYNGGLAVLQEVDPSEASSLREALTQLCDALPEGFLSLMRNGPAYLRRGDFLFVHAGISPDHPLEDTFSLPRSRTLDHPFRRRHWAWIREGFLDATGGWPGRVGCVVHGHTMTTTTPVADAEEALNLLDCRDQHGRICLDAGAAAGAQVAAMEILGEQMRFHISPAQT